MGKKKSAGSIGLIYLLGMLVSVAGFCCPMFTAQSAVGKWLEKASGSVWNGFKFINFDNSTFVTIGALLLFVGAVAGALFGLLSLLKIKLPSAKMLALVALIVVLVGAIVLVIGFTTNGGIYKAIGKNILKHATFGFYMVIGGWVVGLLGFLLGK